jgi:hypothetical protein
LPVSLHHVVIDAHDLVGVARFWSQVLDWPILSEREREVVIGPAEEAIRRYLDTVTVAHAGVWIDTPQRVMTYWFVGDDVTKHRDAISELADGAAVCVTRGSRQASPRRDRARLIVSGAAGR